MTKMESWIEKPPMFMCPTTISSKLPGNTRTYLFPVSRLTPDGAMPLRSWSVVPRRDLEC